VACIPLILNELKVRRGRGPAVDSTKNDEVFIWLHWGLLSEWHPSKSVCEGSG